MIVCVAPFPGHLKSSQLPSGIFQIPHMNLWGHLPKPPRHNEYVIILTDNLSKYVIAEALPDCTAKSDARSLVDRFILIQDAPENLVIDSGTQFNNNLLRTITISMNTPHAFAASYHP